MHVIVPKRSRSSRKGANRSPKTNWRLPRCRSSKLSSRSKNIDMLAWNRELGLRITGTRLGGPLPGAHSAGLVERACTRTPATLAGDLPASPSGASQHRKVRACKNKRGKGELDQTRKRDFVVPVLSSSKKESGHRGIEDRSRTTTIFGELLALALPISSSKNRSFSTVEANQPTQRLSSPHVRLAMCPMDSFPGELLSRHMLI
jgi:hypothetical protein